MIISTNIRPVQVGKFLRNLRIEAGIESLADAAKKVGCSNVNNYTNIENGRRSITPETMLDYATKMLGDKNEALNRMLLWAMSLHDAREVGIQR